MNSINPVLNEKWEKMSTPIAASYLGMQIGCNTNYINFSTLLCGACLILVSLPCKVAVSKPTGFSLTIEHKNVCCLKCNFIYYILRNIIQSDQHLRCNLGSDWTNENWNNLNLQTACTRFHCQMCGEKDLISRLWNPWLESDEENLCLMCAKLFTLWAEFVLCNRKLILLFFCCWGCCFFALLWFNLKIHQVFRRESVQGLWLQWSNRFKMFLS